MSKIPSLEEMLKLYTKKDLWGRIQQHIQTIDQLKQQLEDEKKLHSLAKAFYDEKQAEFDKLLYDYNKLKQQLAEKDKEIESLHETISNKVTSAYGADLMAKSIQFFLEKENHELKQNQTQLAIQELEKVNKYADEDFRKHCYIDAVQLEKFINQQIKDLKGE